jgi:DNA-binding protein HU-beta
MNKAELIEEIATQVGLSKKAAKEAVDAMFATISKTMCDGEPVRITGFGTFTPKPRRSRPVFNPLTRQRIVVGSQVVPGFKPGSDLKDMVRKRLKVVESAGELSIVKAVR